ncbi:thioesterase family protein [Jannaschia formosa]|uniref:thioesterase family protein n=1 Tax=Jannaschia formosa TaxID=2259592 RepID=UPI000E1C2351|nr:thioesterase family protein [Jannaschia formosa]TFL20134.1 thioesterase [Jannaschia formosa]
MYPFLRLALQTWRLRRAPRIAPTDTHVSHHLCWPWDLDGYLELNNGRTLTLYDLGRFGAGARMGLIGMLQERRWGMAVAGASVRYRRRVTAFQRIEMRTRLVGWDDRFIYIVQSMWVKGTCTSEALLRTAVTSRAGTVPANDVAAALGWRGDAPEIPAWVRAWIEAEGTRPWPPPLVPEGQVPPAVATRAKG